MGFDTIEINLVLFLLILLSNDGRGIRPTKPDAGPLKCRYFFAMMKAHYKIEELSWTSNSTWTKSKVKWKFFKRVKGTYTYST